MAMANETQGLSSARAQPQLEQIKSCSQAARTRLVSKVSRAWTSYELGLDLGSIGTNPKQAERELAKLGSIADLERP